MSELPGEVTRLDTTTVLIGVRRRPSEAPGAAEARVRQWLAPSGAWHVRGEWRDDVGLLVASEAEPPDDLELVCWGRPFDEGGVVGRAQVAAALRDPARTAAWSGWFVVAGWTEDGLRLITSTDLTATLRTAEGSGGSAVATRGGVALAAAGRTPAIVAAHVAEFILLDYVLGDDELLDGVRVLPPAATATLGREDTTIATHTDPASWLGTGGPATSPADLLDALRGSLAGLAAAGTRPLLALTAGRDSRLVARALADLAAMPRTFTIGGGPDAVGAARLARSLDWRHEVVAPDDTGTDASATIDWRRGVTSSRWTDGLATVWDSVGPGLSGPVTEGPAWDMISGSGGEIGRGFYWAGHADDVEPARVVLHGVEHTLSADQAEHVRRRLQQATANLPGAPTDQREVLDLLYAYGRMRKWLGHSRTTVPVRSLTAAYTQRPVATALLRLPTEDKRTGAPFDELTSVLPPVRTRAPLRARIRRRLTSGGAGGGRTDADPVVALAAAHLPGGFVEEVLGREAVATLADATPGPARRRTWNALTVEALAQSI